MCIRDRDGAIAQFIQTRTVEGENLKKNLIAKLDGMLELVGQIEERAPKIIAEYRDCLLYTSVLVNSKKPHGQEAKEKVKKLEDTYQIRAMTVNCEQIKEEDIYQILEAVLYEFPVSEVQFYIPKWVEMLPVTHKIKQDLLEHIQEILGNLEEIKDAVSLTLSLIHISSEPAMYSLTMTE